MKLRQFDAVLLVVACCLSGDALAAFCVPIAGLVRLDPDPECKIIDLYPGPAYLGLIMPGAYCYRVTMSGGLLGTGYAGFTQESISVAESGIEVPLGTPLTLHESGLSDTLAPYGLSGTRMLFTARSVLNLPGGRVYTADSGVISGADSVEMLRLTGGDGLYRGISGLIYSSGQAIGHQAGFHGKLCMAPPTR